MTEDNGVKLRKQFSEELTIIVTPEELAELFWASDSYQQARFFSHLAELTQGANLPLQLNYVAEETALTQSGRHVMGLIGEYGEVLPERLPPSVPLAPLREVAFRLNEALNGTIMDPAGNRDDDGLLRPWNMAQLDHKFHPQIEKLHEASGRLNMALSNAKGDE